MIRLKPSNQQDIVLSGFKVFIHPQTTLHKQVKRGSEGLAIFIKEDLKHHMTFDILPSQENSVKMSSDFFYR